jgi:hypothetical protein
MTPTTPVYIPCSACSAMVLHGRTEAGVGFTLDTQTLTFTVVWHTGAPQPLLQCSRAYAVHQCQPMLVPSSSATCHIQPGG